ncbi:MAG: nitronate monooxygenase [Dehalococcoidia bacterium SM23_28_2]|nr:MAG: nitronate monooxygenase [Dehalococcoidia bacterium SM23_28_2]
MFETKITKLFNIKYPIICGGMYWIGRAELVAAVANAGGLGFIVGATFESLDDLRAEIRKARDLTDGPIGLNINLFPALRPQPIEAWVELACEEKIPVVETSGRSPEAIVEPLHAGGVKIMHKVPGVKYARTVERLGCDAVCVVGHECGGHPGMDEVTTLVMVPATVDAMSIPVVAAGGFADGRGLVAALALGADAVLMGTRFMATKECRGHPAWKEWLVNAAETDTAYLMKSIKNPSRVIKNAVAAKVTEMEAQGATLEQLIPVIAGQGGAVFDDGKMDSQLASAGQAIGLIHDVPTVKELIDRMVEEAIQIRERLNAAIGSA